MVPEIKHSILILHDDSTDIQFKTTLACFLPCLIFSFLSNPNPNRFSVLSIPCLFAWFKLIPKVSHIQMV